MEQKDHQNILNEHELLVRAKKMVQLLKNSIAPIESSIEKIDSMIFAFENPTNQKDWELQVKDILGESWWGNEKLRVLPLFLRLSTPIESLEMTVRPRNVLGRNYITTVLQILHIPLDTLMSFENFGWKSLREIKYIIEDLDLMEHWILYSGTASYRLNMIVGRRPGSR